MSHAPGKKPHASDSAPAPDAPVTAETAPAPKPNTVQLLVRSDVPAMLRQVERRAGITPERCMSMALAVAEGHANTSVWRITQRPEGAPEPVPEGGYQYGMTVSRRWYEAHGPIAWSLGISLGELVTIAVPAITGWLERVPKFRIGGNPKVEDGVRRLKLASKPRGILGYQAR